MYTKYQRSKDFFFKLLLLLQEGQGYCNWICLSMHIKTTHKMGLTFHTMSGLPVALSSDGLEGVRLLQQHLTVPNLHSMFFSSFY